MLGIFAVWERGEDAPHRAWADAVEAALKPYALPSASPTISDRIAPSRPRRPMGRTLPGCLRIKAHYDPNGVFAATSLPVLA